MGGVWPIFYTIYLWPTQCQAVQNSTYKRSHYCGRVASIQLRESVLNPSKRILNG